SKINLFVRYQQSLSLATFISYHTLSINASFFLNFFFQSILFSLFNPVCLPAVFLAGNIIYHGI
ncbi:MAG TPA: hypothetical protein DCK78_06825, partial [Paenibacillus lactis]|nr:hypothetical protein [Paenibacillus lactis]